ncbi:MAG TPA: GNAT family N-acetyltransferase [Myxococcaceae bacterium]|jgi:RimJ/RimL family protein N-acetyltransferase
MPPPPALPADTARLTFHWWRDEDEPLAMALWGDSRVTALIDARGTLDAEAVRQKLQAEIARGRQHGLQYWPVFLRSTAAHAGCCGLRPYPTEPGVLELGFHLRAEHWGHGYATEAARSAIDHAFARLGAGALFAGHHPKNGASRKALLKLGFRYTGDERYAPTGLLHPSYRLDRPATDS